MCLEGDVPVKIFVLMGMYPCTNMCAELYVIGVAALQTMVRQDCHRTVFEIILFMHK